MPTGKTSQHHQNGQGSAYETAARDAIFSTSEKTDAVFVAAQRHSGRVRFVKLALPILAVVIALVFSWFTFFATPKTGDSVVINDGMDENGRITMLKPEVQGYSKTNEPYSLTAAKAIQDPTQSGIIELQDISAHLPFGTRGRAEVEAQSGVYDNINGRLRLTKPFTVTTSDGLVAKMLSADVNLETSQLSTNEAVDIRRDGQHLAAKAMQISDDGKRLVFRCGVRLRIDNQTAQ